MEKAEKRVRVGSMPRKDYQRYLVEVSRGEKTLAQDAPRIWFSSYESMFQVLNSRNIELLGLIISRQPESITQLAEISGRKLSNLSRTLKNFENAGILAWEKSANSRAKRPVVTANSLDIRISFAGAK